MKRYPVMTRKRRFKRAASSNAARTISQSSHVLHSVEKALVGAHVNLSGTNKVIESYLSQCRFSTTDSGLY